MNYEYPVHENYDGEPFAMEIFDVRKKTKCEKLVTPLQERTCLFFFSNVKTSWLRWHDPRVQRFTIISPSLVLSAPFRVDGLIAGFTMKPQALYRGWSWPSRALAEFSTRWIQLDVFTMAVSWLDGESEFVGTNSWLTGWWFLKMCQIYDPSI